MKDPRYSHIPRKYKLGNCYKDVIDYMLQNDDTSLRLCHGWVSGRGVTYGTRFSHAWVENIKTGFVIDPSNNRKKPITMERFVYYAIGNIVEKRVIKYTKKGMLIQLTKTGKAGPWNNKFEE